MANLDTNRTPETTSGEAPHPITEPDRAGSHNVLSAAEVHVTSFGHLHGRGARTMVGLADVALDLRWHFRNPLHDAELRELTGHHPRVRDHVLATPGVRELIAATLATVKVFAAVAQRPITVAVGCGGGRHRGPVFAAELAAELRKAGALHVTVEDLDITMPVVDHTNPDNWDSPPAHQHTNGPWPD